LFLKKLVPYSSWASALWSKTENKKLGKRGLMNEPKSFKNKRIIDKWHESIFVLMNLYKRISLLNGKVSLIIIIFVLEP
jgi:hypothetical protein